MKIYPLIILGVVFLISSPSFAHAGHDHNSMSASFIHLVWLTPTLIALGILYSKLLKKNYQIKTTKSKLESK